MEEKTRLLLLGESGTSKSTLLMEIMCAYLEKEYHVFYSFGNEELKNENELCETLEGLLEAGNKLLVVVDNVHDKKTSLIFHIINNLSTLTEEETKNIHFLLAARIPEFDWLVQRNELHDAKLIQLIDSLFIENSKYSVPHLSHKEVKGFVEQYKNALHDSIKDKTIEENTKEIYKDTNGHRIAI